MDPTAADRTLAVHQAIGAPVAEKPQACAPKHEKLAKHCTAVVAPFLCKSGMLCAYFVMAPPSWGVLVSHSLQLGRVFFGVFSWSLFGVYFWHDVVWFLLILPTPGSRAKVEWMNEGIIEGGSAYTWPPKGK
jgi:hypothetical protein